MINAKYDVYIYRPEGGIDTPDLSGEPWCATFVGPDGPDENVPGAVTLLCAYFVEEADALAFQRIWREAVGLPVDMANKRGEA